MNNLTHVDAEGRAGMVDVSSKPATLRTATASGELRCSRDAFDAACAGEAPKGPVLVTAELAGIMAAKRTSDLIPLCHPLSLSKVSVEIAPVDHLPGFRVRAEVRTTGPTGVEMEALTAVSVACLTLFDMLKAIDRAMVIGEVTVQSKQGGQSGEWRAVPE